MNDNRHNDSTIEPRSSRLYRWGRFAARNPWRVIGCWVLVAAAALLTAAIAKISSLA